MYTNLIPLEELAAHLDDPDWAIFDCRYSFDDPSYQQSVFNSGHIPGAIPVNLDHDLSGPIIRGHTGRHPLPSLEEFANRLSGWGVDEKVQMVVYDDSLVDIVAYRLWWMARWAGHQAVAVLDGGLKAWVAAGLPLEQNLRPRQPRRFSLRKGLARSILLSEVETCVAGEPSKLLDARSYEVYLGIAPPVNDPFLGHIPGAMSMPAAENFDSEGRFLSPNELREKFLDVLGRTRPEDAILYCGSGVRATQLAFAFVYAGLPEPGVYIGSWSEWIVDPHHPVVVSNKPQKP